MFSGVIVAVFGNQKVTSQEAFHLCHINIFLPAFIELFSGLCAAFNFSHNQPLLLPQVLKQNLPQKITGLNHLGVGYPVEDLITVPPLAEKALVAEHCQMLRDGGLGYLHKLREFAHTVFTPRKAFRMARRTGCARVRQSRACNSRISRSMRLVKAASS